MKIYIKLVINVSSFYFIKENEFKETFQFVKADKENYNTYSGAYLN